jgi:hypothetical protein
MTMSLQISRREFWALWMKFVSNETFSKEEPDFDGDIEGNEQSGDGGSLLTPRSRAKKTENLGWHERIHARYAPSRRLKQRFFEDQTLVGGIDVYPIHLLQ